MGKNGGARPGAGNKLGSIRTNDPAKVVGVKLTRAEIEAAKAVTGCKSAYAACKALILLGIKNSKIID